MRKSAIVLSCSCAGTFALIVDAVASTAPVAER
jgi:hypothetical protein